MRRTLHLQPTCGLDRVHISCFAFAWPSCSFLMGKTWKYHEIRTCPMWAPRTRRPNHCWCRTSAASPPGPTKPSSSLVHHPLNQKHQLTCFSKLYLKLCSSFWKDLKGTHFTCQTCVFRWILGHFPISTRTCPVWAPRTRRPNHCWCRTSVASPPSPTKPSSSLVPHPLNQKHQLTCFSKLYRKPNLSHISVVTRARYVQCPSKSVQNWKPSATKQFQKRPKKNACVLSLL